MVVFGGLEILAAGYVLNEIKKDDKRSQSNDPSGRRRRDKKKKHHHQHHDRPSRPPAHSLMPPPAFAAPGRTNSAPPPQFRPQVPYGGPGQYGPQRPPAGVPPGYPPLGQAKPSTWPAQARPPTRAEQQAWYGRPQQHSLPGGANAPPPVPGMINHAPTMHFDTKTGKWQSNMLPADMQTGSNKPRGMSAGAESGMIAPVLPTRQLPPPPQQQGQQERQLALIPRRRDSDSVSDTSSGSSCSTCDSADEALAYGKIYPKNRNAIQKITSHERRRPSELPAQQRPVELDWYGTQVQVRPGRTGTGPNPTPNANSNLNQSSSPNFRAGSMAQVMLAQQGRANSLPPPIGQYSMSQPDLRIPVELDSTSIGVGGGGGGGGGHGRTSSAIGYRQQTPQPHLQSQSQSQQRFDGVPVELDSTQRYRAYTGRAT